MPEVPSAHTVAAFAVVAVAACSIASNLREYFKLPLITGYIVGGIICGPYILSLLTFADCNALRVLVNDDAMGFIGFSAGSKFVPCDLSGSLRSVLFLLAGLVVTTFTLVITGMSVASPYLALTNSATPVERISMSVIIATLSVARSPSSAIAIIAELGAHGPFTTAALSVTVLMDVIVVLAFSLSMLVVHMITAAPGHESQSPVQVLGLFGLQLVISVAVGVGLDTLAFVHTSCTCGLMAHGGVFTA